MMHDPHQLKRFRLLIVEEDELIRWVWHEIFTRRGWDVTAVSTVAEGLVSLDPAPDYLILALSLPDGGGETILRKVRDEDLKTRVTVMTGIEDAARLRRVRHLNPDALFEKPIGIAEVWREGELARSG